MKMNKKMVGIVTVIVVVGALYAYNKNSGKTVVAVPATPTTEAVADTAVVAPTVVDSTSVSAPGTP